MKTTAFWVILGLMIGFTPWASAEDAHAGHDHGEHGHSHDHDHGHGHAEASTEAEPVEAEVTEAAAEVEEAAEEAPAEEVVEEEATPAYEDGVYAIFNTDKGKIVAKLYHKKCPLTVGNFVGLAEGTKKSNKAEGVPFFDGLTFHRVIPHFMIQGGCPIGNGTGEPGYRFPDEIHEDLLHDKKGILSMANSGKDRNGSQFFITHRATPWLDGRHSIFGEAIEGLEVVDAIERGDKMNTVEILRIGEEAQGFKVDQEVFDQLLADHGKPREEEPEPEVEPIDHEAIIAENWPDALETESGLLYTVDQEGTGTRKPHKGCPIRTHYTGTLIDGTQFDSSHDRGKTFNFTVGVGAVIKAWDEALMDMVEGEKRTIILPPELGYGEQGRPPIIPPNSYLVFEVELVKLDG